MPFNSTASNTNPSEPIIGGYHFCTENAPFTPESETSPGTKERHGGKAIRVLTQGTHSFRINPLPPVSENMPPQGAYDETKIIQVFRWSQPPNTAMNGRVWVADLPRTGGTADVEIDFTYRWVSVFARNENASQPDAHDGCYLSWANGLDIELWTFEENFDVTSEL